MGSRLTWRKRHHRRDDICTSMRSTEALPLHCRSGSVDQDLISKLMSDRLLVALCMFGETQDATVTRHHACRTLKQARSSAPERPHDSKVQQPYLQSVIKQPRHPRQAISVRQSFVVIPPKITFKQLQGSDAHAAAFYATRSRPSVSPSSHPQAQPAPCQN